MLMQVSARIGLVLVPVLFFTACGSKEPPPPVEPKAPTHAADDPNRQLTKSECESLAQGIVEACNSRGNDRSTGMDGWCSDMVRNNAGDGTWVESDCLKHVKYMDYFCFQSAKNAHAMMDCDRTVDRSR